MRFSESYVCLALQALQPLYPIEGSMYSYLGAVSAAACLHLGRVTSEEYNDWVIAVRGVDASSL